MEINLLDGRTICHDVYAKSGASKVILRKAKAGTGIIAGGAMRAVFESLGIHDIVAKSLGSNNPNTMIAATMKALMQVSSPRHIAERRGISTADLFVDSKIDLLSKHKIPVMVLEDQILAVLTLRRSGLYLLDESKQAVSISWKRI